MDNIKDAAVHFEAVKTSMSQSKAGTILRLAIHPNEVPANLHTDWVGSRYMVAMVKLNEQDEPEISVEQREVDKLIASAGMLCRNPSFVEFLHANNITTYDPTGKYPTLTPDENGVAEALRNYLGVTSRADMKTNSQAREKFKSLSEEFTKWKQGRSQ
jgi:hypothetical protein